LSFSTGKFSAFDMYGENASMSIAVFTPARPSQAAAKIGACIG